MEKNLQISLRSSTQQESNKVRKVPLLEISDSLGKVVKRSDRTSGTWPWGLLRSQPQHNNHVG